MDSAEPLIAISPASADFSPSSASYRSYTAPWRGELVLVCRKCTKKVKKHGQSELSRTRKWLKKRAKADGKKHSLTVLETSCMDMCPKGAVTVALARDFASNAADNAAGHPATVSILRSKADLEALYQRIIAGQI